MSPRIGNDAQWSSGSVWHFHTTDPGFYPRAGLWQQFKDDENVSSRYNIRHPRVTMPNEARYLVVTAKISSRSSASDLSRQLLAVTGTTVSHKTNREQTFETSWSICLQASEMCSAHSNSLSPMISLE
ncbi:hypothetical protein TNCV_3785791 [Trichonephila clavipes]|nr:hypothetical protein TNCV_3785791 [Trichonephila clavipes]